MSSFVTNFLQLFTSSSPENIILTSIILIWSLIIKGFGLWKAAKNNQKYWFIAMLVVNTVGVMELIYLKFFQNNLNKAAKKALKNK